MGILVTLVLSFVHKYMFTPMESIPRRSKDIVITEKIDWTNASVIVDEFGNVSAGSKNRIISIDNDNYWFARWVDQNKEQLKLLGEWCHRWEWRWQGIQDWYTMDRKIFSLFAVHRWGDGMLRPVCCDVVPILYSWENRPWVIQETMEALLSTGSVAAKKYGVSFYKPEGVVIYHTASKQLYKKTFDNDAWKRTKGV